MSLLNFEPSGPMPKGEKKSLRIFLGIGLLVGTVALGSTLAASINLNDSGPVEFGQGVTQTTACDDEITLTPTSTFVNAAGAGSHKFSSLNISGINSSSDKCSGKIFVIKAYGDSGILNLFSYTDTANPGDNDTYDFVEIVNYGGDFTWISGGSDGDDAIPGPDIGLTQTSFTLSFTSALGTITRTPLASAEEVVRITIESKDSALAVGETGPGNGIVFYYSEAGFSCGPNLSSTCNYLEAAPNTWSNESEDPQITWSTLANHEIAVTGADDTSIGTGYKNSLAIANQSGNLAASTAAMSAREYFGGGKSDWYLPSKDELDSLYAQKVTVGGFTTENNYWSSSESSDEGAWNQNFGYGYGEQGTNGKFDARAVRPIRAF